MSVRVCFATLAERCVLICEHLSVCACVCVSVCLCVCVQLEAECAALERQANPLQNGDPVVTGTTKPPYLIIGDAADDE